MVVGETADKATAQRHTEYRYSPDGRSVEVVDFMLEVLLLELV